MMVQFYGSAQGNKGEVHRLGDKKSGLDVLAASWNGCITVRLSHNPDTGEDRFSILQGTWQGEGISEFIASGVLGQPTKRGKVGEG